MKTTLPRPAPGAPWQVLALFLLVMGAVRPAAAQAPPWTQATLAGGSSSRVTASATDASGNVFVAGAFQGTVTFGTTTLTADVLGDCFVAKWSPATGQFVWAQAIGDQDDDFATALAVRDSSVYVAGISNSTTVRAGSLSVQAANGGGSGAFLAKLHDRGKSSAFEWLHGIQTVSSIRGLVLVGTSDIYAAGGFDGILRLDGKQLLRDDVSNFGGNMYVMKLADTGPDLTLTWVQQAGGKFGESASALAVVGSSVYVAGRFGSPQATFGPFTLANADQASLEPYADVFVTKLTDAGATSSFVWARQAGGLGQDDVRAMAVAGPNIYLGGTFGGASATFGTQALTPAGGSDGFVAKLTDAGSSADFQWATRVGGPAEDHLEALVVAGNHLYAAGSFQGTATFDGPTVSATSAGRADIFVAHLLDAGASASAAWVQTAGSPQDDNAYTLALVPATGRLYAAGEIGPVPTFGTLYPTTTAPYAAAFVAELGSVETQGVVPPPVMVPPPAAVGPPPTPPAAPVLVPTLLPYPNPAHGVATVALPAGPPGSPVAFTVIDVLGQVVARASAALAAVPTATNVDLSGLAPGVYALRITVGDDTTTPRLVVE